MYQTLNAQAIIPGNPNDRGLRPRVHSQFWTVTGMTMLPSQATWVLIDKQG
jgi:hypothetical protein